MSKLIEFKCDGCGAIGKKQIGHYNSSIRKGKKNYCSIKCSKKEKDKKVEVVCATCGKSFKITRSVYTRSLAKNFFCGHSCSAKHSNSRRKHSEETKQKISASLWIANKDKVKEKKPRIKRQRIETNKCVVKCVVCGREWDSYRPDVRFCSAKCRAVFQCGTDIFRKENVLLSILEVFRQEGFTPQRRQMKNKLAKDANKFFGSWNKAVKECGLKPNTSKFQKTRLKTLDGHMADSISERTIDNCLFNNGYLHERNKKYLNQSKLNCDFYIPEKDLWIEYFGLYGQNEEYDHTVEVKIKIALENGLNWMFLIPDDLYPENKVIEKVENFLNKK